MESDIDQSQTTHTPLEDRRKQVEEKKIESDNARKEAYLNTKKFGEFFINENGINMYTGKVDKDKTPITKVICPIPCSITAMGKNIDDEKTLSYKIEFTDNNYDEKIIWKKEEDLLDSKHVESLRSEGLAFVSRNAGNMNEFFSDYTTTVKEYLPKEIIATRSGWKKNKDIFVYGSYSFDNKGIGKATLIDNPYAKHYHTGGSEKEWVEGLRGILAYDITRMKAYMSVYSIIGQLLYLDPFVVENNYKSGSSALKSDSSMTCNSFWGDPEKLQMAGTSSEKGVVKYAELNNCMPIYLDESTVNKNKEMFKNLLYIIGNGQPRVILNRESKIIEGIGFYVVLIITGETHILDENSFEGLYVRLIILPWGIAEILSVEEIEKIKKTYTENYGWVGKRVVQKVFDYKDKLPDIWRNYLKEFPESDNTKIRRVNKTYAGIATAGIILEEVFKDMCIPTIDPLELTKKLYKENIEDSRIFEEPKYIKALKAIYNWYSSEYTFFRGSDYEISNHSLEDSNNFKPSKNYGWLLYDKKDNYEYVGFDPKTLKDKLKEFDFQDPDQIIKDWAENGIIISNEEKYQDKKSGKEKVRVRYDLSSYISKDLKPRLIRIPVENFNKYTSNKYLDEGIAEVDESEEEEIEFNNINKDERQQNLLETAEGIALIEREEADERAKTKIEQRKDGIGHVRILNNLN